MYASTNGTVAALDLGTGRLAWTLQPPPALGTTPRRTVHGVPPGLTSGDAGVGLDAGALTAFVVDRRRLWLLVGTNRGGLACFDLRFGVLVRSWSIPSLVHIYQLILHPVRCAARPDVAV